MRQALLSCPSNSLVTLTCSRPYHGARKGPFLLCSRRWLCERLLRAPICFRCGLPSRWYVLLDNCCPVMASFGLMDNCHRASSVSLGCSLRSTSTHHGPSTPCFSDAQWQAIEGSYGQWYYYNPKTYCMQWYKPADAVICGVRRKPAFLRKYVFSKVFLAKG